MRIVHVQGGAAHPVSGIRVSLVRSRTMVAAGVSLLLSFMPGLSNAVGFAQEQPRVTVSSQSRPAVKDLLRVPNAWPTGSFRLVSGATLTFGFQDDGYHWMFDGPGMDFLDSRAFEVGSVGAAYVDPLVGGSASNVILELDVGESSGGDDNIFGLNCRGSADGDYLLWAKTDGIAGIDRRIRNATGTFDDNTLVAATVPAAHGYHLRAECIDSHLALSVNGTMVVEIDETAPLDPGRWGLFAGTNESDGGEFVFANLVAQHP